MRVEDLDVAELDQHEVQAVHLGDGSVPVDDDLHAQCSPRIRHARAAAPRCRRPQSPISRIGLPASKACSVLAGSRDSRSSVSDTSADLDADSTTAAPSSSTESNAGPTRDRPGRAGVLGREIVRALPVEVAEAVARALASVDANDRFEAAGVQLVRRHDDRTEADAKSRSFGGTRPGSRQSAKIVKPATAPSAPTTPATLATTSQLLQRLLARAARCPNIGARTDDRRRVRERERRPDPRRSRTAGGCSTGARRRTSPSGY